MNIQRFVAQFDGFAPTPLQRELLMYLSRRPTRGTSGWLSGVKRRGIGVSVALLVYAMLEAYNGVEGVIFVVPNKSQERHAFAEAKRLIGVCSLPSDHRFHITSHLEITNYGVLDRQGCYRAIDRQLIICDELEYFHARRLADLFHRSPVIHFVTESAMAINYSELEYRIVET